MPLRSTLVVSRSAKQPLSRQPGLTAEPIEEPLQLRTQDAMRGDGQDIGHRCHYRQAEVASGTTTTSGDISLTKNHGTHAHICRVYMTGKGVINHAA